MKDMREFLKGLELDSETINTIMAEFGKNVTEDKETITQLTTERDSLKNQLEEVNTKLGEFESMDIDGIKTELGNLKIKYETDTQELQDKLAKQNYEYKVKDKVSGLKFTSESAKKAFLNDLISKELKIENDTILGFDDFVKTYKETDPNAFESEEPKPQFSSQNRPTSSDAGLAELRSAMGLANEK